jgi:competence protein ComEC
LEKTVRSILPEPQAALLEGLLWGSRSGLPDSVQNDFKRAGMSHQVAVSGFNTTIIAAFLSALLFRLGLNRTSVLVASCLGLASFVIISGASAAVVRAAFMSLSVLIARWLGRPASAGHTLIVVAAAMVVGNPWLIYDIGFQLSAAATAGLVYLSPMIEPYLVWMPEKMGLRENMATTLAATFTTLPVTIGHFGQFSIISPLANALTLPLLPITMAIGGAAVGLGLVSSALGSAAALVAWLPLSYLLAIPHLFASIPWAAVTLEPIGWLAIFLYAPMVALLVYRKKSCVCPLSVG